MFNVGGPEIVVIFLVALIVLGPEQLPKAMRTLGNLMTEIRKVSSGFQTEMRNAMDTMTVDTTVPTTARPTSAPATAERPEDADVTEIVARNHQADETSPDTGSTAALDGTADGAAPPSGFAPVDPADRAAG